MTICDMKLFSREFHKSPSLPKTVSSDRRRAFPPTPSGCIPKHSHNRPPNDTQMTDATVSSNNCICNRPASHIVCTKCGFELVGRLQKVCPDHPKKLALMDHRECPNRLCKSIHLIEVSLQH
ncbi:unnamed protein product [Cercopithifilaria johnstoni]|uniref:Uncharacterized protein n=1 Tax=Cercopithifilaria johnstoni TaxID=2874296 RepID=A0A8J2Q8R4_9BILA|nr:unnamed protein product [Cercopithifilaria johnstoni]